MGIALALLSVPFAILLTVTASVVLGDASLGGILVWSLVFAGLIFTLVRCLQVAKFEEPDR